jgi:hypothetical protein
MMVYPSESSSYTQYEDNVSTEYSCSEDDSKIILEISGQVRRDYDLNIFSEIEIKSAVIQTGSKIQTIDHEFNYNDKFINIRLKGITQAKITMMK